MKKTFTFLALAALCLFACKKDDSKPETKQFETISFADIKAKEAMLISYEDIAVRSPAAVQLNEGAIIFYKTNLGNFGKLKVLSVNNANYEVTVNMVTYDTEGNEIVSKDGVAIILNKYYDFDTGLETIDTTIADLSYYDYGIGYTYFNPLVDSGFNLYFNE